MSGCLGVHFAELAHFPNFKLYSFSLCLFSGSQIRVLSLIHGAFSLFLWKPPAAWRLPLLTWTQKARLSKACLVCLPSPRNLSGFNTLPTLLFFVQTLLNWPRNFCLRLSFNFFFYQLGQEPPKDNPDTPGTMNPGMWWEHVLIYSWGSPYTFKENQEKKT